MLAIATRADNRIKEMTDITHPIIKDYAKKCNADFIILGEQGEPHYHYRILQLYELFQTYQRVATLDSDILIMPTCPDLFETVPEDKIGTVLEDKGSRLKDRRERISKIQMKFGNAGWQTGYINTGVAVFSKQHSEIFKKRELWMDFGYDDVYLGYWIHKLGLQIHELPFQFNHMRMFSEPWNGNPHRYDSHIIHYAGGGTNKFAQLEEIKNDYEKLFNR